MQGHLGRIFVVKSIFWGTSAGVGYELARSMVIQNKRDTLRIYTTVVNQLSEFKITILKNLVLRYRPTYRLGIDQST